MSRHYLKILYVLLFSVILLTGCGINQKGSPVTPSGSKTEESETLTIATSFYPMYLFTLNVAKDIPNVNVINLTPSTAGDLHDYALTTEDIKKLEQAQILVINGAGAEPFMDKLLQQRSNLKVITASEGIELIEGDEHVPSNPHVWVSISNAILEVQSISEQLSALDPKNASKYQENASKYIAKLDEQRKEMHEILDPIDNHNIITFHDAFPYFAKEFNLNIVRVIEREPGSEPSAKELSDIIKIVKDLKIRALFAEPQYPPNVANIIAKETGAKVYTLDPVATGPMNDPDAYIEIMDRNLETLQEALTK